MEEAVIKKEGIEYRFNRRSKKTFLTQFGRIQITTAKG